MLVPEMRGTQLVREARKRAGLTQAELAARTGTTQSAIARIEGGAVSPSLAHLTELVQAAGFDIDVRLVPYDDHDLSMALRNRTLTPEQRLENMLAFQRFAQTGREAMLAAKAAERGNRQRARRSGKGP
jgi:transcriptional regulator with XRE-family HTH domain